MWLLTAHNWKQAAHADALAVDELLSQIVADEVPQHGGMLMLTDGMAHASPSPSPSHSVTPPCTPPSFEKHLALFRRIGSVGERHVASDDDVEEVVRPSDSYGLEPARPCVRSDPVRRQLTFDEALSSMSPAVAEGVASRVRPTDKLFEVAGVARKPATAKCSAVRPVKFVKSSSSDSALAEARALAAAMQSVPCPAGVGAQSRTAVKNGAVAKKGRSAIKAKPAACAAVKAKPKSRPVARVKAKPACADIVPNDDADAASSTVASQFVSMDTDEKREFVRAKLVKLAVARGRISKLPPCHMPDVAEVGVGVAADDSDADGEVVQPAIVRPCKRVRSKSKPTSCKAGDLHASSNRDAIAVLAFKHVDVPVGEKIDEDYVIYRV